MGAETMHRMNTTGHASWSPRSVLSSLARWRILSTRGAETGWRLPCVIVTSEAHLVPLACALSCTIRHLGDEAARASSSHRYIKASPRRLLCVTGWRSRARPALGGMGKGALLLSPPLGRSVPPGPQASFLRETPAVEGCVLTSGSPALSLGTSSRVGMDVGACAWALSGPLGTTDIFTRLYWDLPPPAVCPMLGGGCWG